MASSSLGVEPPVFSKVGILAKLTSSLFSNDWTRTIVSLEPRELVLRCFPSGEAFDAFVEAPAHRREQRCTDRFDLRGAFVYLTTYWEHKFSFEVSNASEYASLFSHSLSVGAGIDP